MILEILEDRTLPSATNGAVINTTLQLIPAATKDGVGHAAENFEIEDFHFGVEHPTTIGSATSGAGAGKTKFKALDVTAEYNADASLAFAHLASGSHYKTATLTETNGDGQPVAVWILGTVFVTEDRITKNQAGLPVEELTFVFGSATEANSTQSACWNQLTNKANGPVLPPGFFPGTVP